MKTLTLYQVDAFTDQVFRGNPAAVCILDEWLEEDLMQSIALENNLAETAFVKPNNDRYEIRWFTPTIEVDLCGHATLASAWVLFKMLDHQGIQITFWSPRSGGLKVSNNDGFLEMDFPADKYSLCQPPDGLSQALGNTPKEVYKGKTDYMAVFENEEQIKNLLPDFFQLSKIETRGTIVTAPGTTTDFVSRFFAPQSGIAEDPVTGSAHTTLIPYWADKLGKKELKARQISPRGGDLWCRMEDGRVNIGGRAELYLKGEIYLP